MRKALSLGVLAALLIPSVALAQTITGTIVGTITDPGGLAIVDADVVLTQVLGGVQRQTKTLTGGEFVFNAVDRGLYTVAITSPGFKKTERTNINLTASERLSLGSITLEVGQVTENITVKADSAAVQVASAEHSGVFTSSQVENLQIKGRNVITMLQLLPGVVDTNAPDAPDRNFAIGLSVNGQRRNAIGTTMDGMQTQDSGTGWISTANISMDAIAEVKVLLNNYQAEYGRMRGAGVMMIGKSGTRDFHGSFSYFKRHEQFNANDFFNNRNGIKKPRYRYNTYSYTIGGPVYIPGKFNTEKNKLFFFWSQEIWPQKTGVPVTFVTMPSALERTGNFSQTVDVNNRLIPVRDPQTGQPFPGNIVPANRLDANGLALLKFLPLPNFADRTISGGAYNYVNQVELDKPQVLSTMKIDYNLTSNDIFSVTWSRQQDTQTGSMGLATPNSNWPAEFRRFWTKGNVLTGRYQKILSPTLVNELVLGYNWRVEGEDISDDVLKQISRSGAGYNGAELFPGSNPQGLLPNVAFGGIPNPANITLTGIPLGNRYPTYTITDNITKTFAKHNVKAGIFLNRQATGPALANASRGNLSFAVDVNNPFDSGYTYSNAALGSFTSFAQANRVVGGSTVWKAAEWFVQDSWKVHRRVTVEMGIRFLWMSAALKNNPSAMFSPAAWSTSRVPALITPTLVNGARRGVDPKTGTIYPAVAIGLIAPGSGDPANGMIINTQPGVPKGLINGPGITYNPRFGFAWDVFGNGKTAVRGGFGIFQSSGANGEGAAGSEGAIPLVYNVSVPYGQLNTLTSSGGLLSPSSVGVRQDPMGVATSYNLSFGVQQNIGKSTVVEVGYVGTLGRHLNWAFDYDPVPLGANFDPANRDPTTASSPLSANFLRRPYYGFSGVTYTNWGGTSNYHSMQVSATRRFTERLQFGVSYTWSKNLNSADFDNTVMSPFVPARIWNYGLSTYDRTHNLRMNFLFDTPRVWYNNVASRWVLNGWQIGGINAFISGSPSGVGFTTTNNADITGTTSAGPRINVLSDPVLPKDQRTFAKNFRTDVFAVPARGTLGNAARTIIRGPGTENWDLSVFKNFPIREPMRLQFRAEFYNAFNHTQFSGLDTGARFDPAGTQVNPTLGQFTASRPPRQIQLALRFTF